MFVALRRKSCKNIPRFFFLSVSPRRRIWFACLPIFGDCFFYLKVNMFFSEDAFRRGILSYTLK